MMPRKLRTKEWLQLIGAVDDTPREIMAKDYIELSCHDCGFVGKSRAGNIHMSLEKKGYGYRCQSCKNLVIGKKVKARGGIKPVNDLDKKTIFENQKENNRAPLRTEEQLISVYAIDTTPRRVAPNDYLEVRCWECNSAGLAKYTNQVERLKSMGRMWRCKSCVRSGISKNKTNEWNNRTVEEKAAKGEKLREDANKKFNGNPMFNADVAAKHYNSVNSKEFIQQATEKGLERAKDVEFVNKMKNESNKFWASDAGYQEKEKAKERVLASFNDENGKFYQIRKKAISRMWQDKERAEEIIKKMSETILDKYGFPHAMQNPEIRRKALSKKGMTNPEKYIFEMLLNRGFDFKYNEVLNGKCWDFIIYENSKPVLIIEVDGEYAHGLISDPFYANSGGHSDDKRSPLVPHGCKFLVVDSLLVKDAIPEIASLLCTDYVSWIEDLYNECINMDFPYPKYDALRMIGDWKNLKRLFNEKTYNDKKIPGNSIITNFHKSIYRSRCGNHPSPFEAWSNPELLLKCIENRFVYKSSLSSQQVARGFERNKIAPRVTVFQPSLARYILDKYANDAKTVVDPCSGFSGRMLGAASLNKNYTGYDINENTISESREIIKFLKLGDVSLSVADLEKNTDFKEYDVLFTCPPYGDKERWEDRHYHPAEYYIDKILRNFKAKKYIFVVDNPGKYSEHVVELIGRKSHLAESNEKIVIIDKLKDMP